MSSIVLKGSTSGDVTVQAPAVATGTVTMPSATGTLLTTTGDGSSLTGITTATNTPAFSVRATGITASNNTWTKFQLDNEEFDTDNAFDATTNYRFTVPSGEGGKYLFGGIGCYGTDTTTYIRNHSVAFYVDGSRTNETRSINSSGGGRHQTATITAILDLSASQYVEFYGYASKNAGDLGFDSFSRFWGMKLA